MRSIRIGMAQVNPTVGDLEGNVKLVINYINRARSLDVDLLTFPEMVVTGYPPEDLLLKREFLDQNLEALGRIAHECIGLTTVVGFVDSQSDLYNSAAVLHNGEVKGIYHKVHLPNYGVFDENRYFRRGSEVQIFTVEGVRVGVSICEDIWQEVGPPTVQALAGAEVLVNISGSPYHSGKGEERLRILSARASDNLAYVAYNNIVGGQDELVFDGHGMIIDEKGSVVARGKQFEEDLVVADLDADRAFKARLHTPRARDGSVVLRDMGLNVRKIHISGKSDSRGKPELPQRSVGEMGFPAEVYAALVLGTRDYVRKNGFEEVVIGLSGGIDSSLVATIAVDALGKENVIGVYMPSRYSSPESEEDASKLAENLGVRLIHISIDDIFEAFLDSLTPQFEGTEADRAEENLQARARGDLLMALSNKFGWMVLATGNKSEMAIGYATLYGDMCGGLAVIKDVPKTLVYGLSKYRNSKDPLIPDRVMEKAPSAELRPEQRDTDALPPYEVLDPILESYVEKDMSVEDIVERGFDEHVVRRVIRMVDGSEFKRRQSTPGIKITPRSFGKDRRLPITNKFRP